ncbi:MAG: YtxH protein [Candidatus Saccharibacteria bacterium]|nr:YtxH protein [Candidatus Saccharibacteria bacterium]
MNKAFKRLALGTVIAGAAGYVAGLLTAPKSGRATRKDIKDAADNTITETERQFKKLHTELNELLNETKKQSKTAQGKAKTELDDLTAKAVTAKEKAREILSAIHEGDTENKELQRAMNDATKAVKHLKTFLKK